MAAAMGEDRRHMFLVHKRYAKLQSFDIPLIRHRAPGRGLRPYAAVILKQEDRPAVRRRGEAEAVMIGHSVFVRGRCAGFGRRQRSFQSPRLIG